MGQGGSKPEDIVAIANQSVNYNPPLGAPNPVRDMIDTEMCLSGFDMMDTEICVAWQLGGGSGDDAAPPS